MITTKLKNEAEADDVLRVLTPTPRREE